LYNLQILRCGQDGKLFHSDLGKIWDKYPEELRLWLLRLTEEFDLTFPSKEEPANIVPCLLPAAEPEVCCWAKNTHHDAYLHAYCLTYQFDFFIHSQ